MIERMLADHARLRDCADRLEALLASSSLPDSDALAAARWALGSTMMQHLAFEERHLYAALRDDPRDHVRQTAAIFHEQLASSFVPYADHTKQWTPERVTKSWESYRAQTQALIATMRARMAREEQELYPLVHRNGIDTRHSGVPSRNWAREAFAIKERIGGR
jgi:hemerythrin-like domain-containing protein